MIRAPAGTRREGVVAMTRFKGLKSMAVLSVAAATCLIGSLPVEAAGQPLIYHGNEANASFVSDANGVTVMVHLSSSDYTYSTGAELQGTGVAITLTDEVTGQELDRLDGFVATSASFAANLHSATLDATSLELQSSTSCCAAQTISVSAVWTATGPPDHFTMVSHFCGPPQPCFGIYNVSVTTRDATIAMTIGGMADGIDLSQLVWTNSAGINSRIGVYLTG